MTHDNVAEIFDEINPSQSDYSEIFDEINPSQSDYSYCNDDCKKQQSKNFQPFIQLYRDLPRDLFVRRIQSDYNSDERLLYQLRGDLFSKLKESDKYSFVPGQALN